jgi:PLP dependent protein
MPPVFLSDSLARLEQEIAAACTAAGRRRDEITLIAVSKTFPAAAVREAHAIGLRDFGENRVQELAVKASELRDLDLRWHLIGSLQTNKVRAALPLLGMLHSLDREALLEEINRRTDRGHAVEALLQVNTTGESSKAGVSPEHLEALIERVRASRGIRLRGLMTIGPLGGGEAACRRAFARLRELRDGSIRRHPDLDLRFLSMGMSGDFAAAIAEGATHLRIGARLFGDRG